MRQSGVCHLCKDDSRSSDWGLTSPWHTEAAAANSGAVHHYGINRNHMHELLNTAVWLLVSQRVLDL